MEELILTEDQIAELRDAFGVFDQDGDGSITPEELSRVMEALGKTHSQVEIREMVEEFDADRNGTIEIDEFLILMSEKMKETEAHDDLRAAFNVLDKQNTGLITVEDLKYAMTNLGEMLSDAEVQDMIRVADADGDGKISFKDFLHIIKSQR